MNCTVFYELYSFLLFPPLPTATFFSLSFSKFILSSAPNIKNNLIPHGLFSWYNAFFFENKNISNLFLFQLYNQKKPNLCKHLYKYLHCSFFIAIFSYFENSISFWFCLNKLSAYLPIIFIFQDYFSK